MTEREGHAGTMAYVERGEGPAVVLLHAFPVNGGMWRPQMEALAGSRRVISPDYPGFGRSPHPPAQPDAGHYAERVRELLDHLSLERVVLGGLSMGGYVAFECLRRFPERISALILANTRADADSEEMRETRQQTAERVAAEGVEVLIDLQMQRLLAPQTFENKKEVVERVRAMIRQATPDGAVGALGALRERPDSTALLERIGVPTLVIGGEEDAISSPEIMGSMAEKIPGSRYLVLPDAGHLSNLEAPEKFSVALREFLAEV